MPVRLRVVDDAGASTGTVFNFDTADTFIVGRDVRAHARILDDPGVSRHHFLIEVHPPRARLKDLGSTNGVHINDVLYGGRDGLRDAEGAPPPVDLVHGDRIRVGNTRFIFEVLEDAGRDAGGSDDDFGGMDVFCERCGKMIAAQSVARVDGRTVCMACRAALEEARTASAPNPKPAVGRLADLLRARTGDADTPPAISGYTLDRLAGQGAMGAVYHGTRDADGLEVAVKVVRPGLAVTKLAVAQFRREIDISRRLVHENIVAFIDAGGEDDLLYLAMEYVNGGSISGHLKRYGPLTPAHALPWMRQMAAGVAVAHGLGLIHRDIKPANVLLQGSGTDAVAKIADFGLAKSFLAAGISQFTATGTAAGTATCMPPEQLTDFKRVGKTADVFALGASYYEMLTRRSPYNFKPGQDPMMAVLSFDITPLAVRAPSLPAELAAVVDRCLRAAPEERPADAGALLAALNTLA